MQTEAYTAQVLEAARNLVAAFSRTDTEAYFAAFSEDATFIFHTWPQPLFTRDAYREVWNGWVRDGLQILECHSSDAHVSLQSDEVAVFSHAVETKVRIQGEESSSRERETIVFRRDQQGCWLATHEHLSPAP